VRSILALNDADGWKPPIVLTEAVRGEGVAELWEQVCLHRRYLEENDLIAARRGASLAREVFAVASARAKAHLEQAVAGDAELARLLEQVKRRELDPLTAVREIMEKVFRVEHVDGDGAEPR
jgi:LAO/AO transport system kinase